MFCVKEFGSDGFIGRTFYSDIEEALDLKDRIIKLQKNIRVEITLIDCDPDGTLIETEM